MKKLFFSLCILILLLSLTFPPLGAQESMARSGSGSEIATSGSGMKKKDTVSNLIYLVKVNGEIDRGLTPFIRRVISEADEQGASAVIIEINTLGGRMDAAIDIRDVLLNSKTQTIAYVNKRAISAGALISLACQKITMTPGATIGAAMPVIITPFDQKMQPASEKVISYFRKEMKATAEKNHRPALIAEAMVDQDVVIEGLTEGKKLLTLTSSEALRYKVADFEVSNGVEEILQKFNLQPARLVEERANWAEKFLRIVSGSLLSSLLLTIGLLGLILELRTPTWGIAGTVGFICLAIFFWGHVVLNLVGWEEVALLLVGTILLLLEVFVIPGFGMTGILGLIALAAGLTLSLVGKNPTAWEIRIAVSQISIVLFVVLIAFVWSMKFLVKSSIAQRLVLHARSGAVSKANPAAHAEPAPIELSRNAIKSESSKLSESSKSSDWIQYLNQEGVAFTNLRPAGKATFGEKRLNVISEGDFIEKGSLVRIIRVEGTKIMVQKIGKKEEVGKKEEG